jgi:hypothetical protein
MGQPLGYVGQSTPRTWAKLVPEYLNLSLLVVPRRSCLTVAHFAGWIDVILVPTLLRCVGVVLSPRLGVDYLSGLDTDLPSREVGLSGIRLRTHASPLLLPLLRTEEPTENVGGVLVPHCDFCFPLPSLLGTSTLPVQVDESPLLPRSHSILRQPWRLRYSEWYMGDWGRLPFGSPWTDAPAQRLVLLGPV